jgi:hypothetical protein
VRRGGEGFGADFGVRGVWGEGFGADFGVRSLGCEGFGVARTFSPAHPTTCSSGPDFSADSPFTSRESSLPHVYTKHASGSVSGRKDADASSKTSTGRPSKKRMWAETDGEGDEGMPCGDIRNWSSRRELESCRPSAPVSVWYTVAGTSRVTRTRDAALLLAVEDAILREWEVVHGDKSGRWGGDRVVVVVTPVSRPSLLLAVFGGCGAWVGEERERM